MESLYRRLLPFGVLLALVLAGCAAPAEPAPERPLGQYSPRVTTTLPQAESLSAEVRDGAVSVSWSIVGQQDQLSSYVEYGPGSLFSQRTEPRPGSGPFLQELADLQPGTAYAYRIAIEAGGKVLARSPAGSFATPAGPPPPADPLPLRLSDVAARGDGARAIVSWTVSGGIEPVQSQVEWGKDTGYGNLLPPVNGTGTLWSAVPMEPGSTIHFRVLVRHGGTPATSPDHIFTLPTGAVSNAPVDTAGGSSGGPGAGPCTDGVPPQVSNIATGTPTPDSALIQFTVSDNNNDAGTASKVAYGTSPTLTMVGPTVEGLGPLSSTIFGLSPGTTYYMRVLSSDTCGASGQSDLFQVVTPGGGGGGGGGAPPTPTTATPPPTPPPTTPPNPCSPDTTNPSVTGVSVSSITASSVLVEWTATDNCSGVTSKVEFSTDMSFSQSSAIQSGAGAQSATLSGLAAGTAYNYRVRATDAAANTVVSAAAVFSTASAADTTPPMVGVISVTAVTTTSITVSWSVSEPESSASASTQVQYGTTPAYGSLSAPQTGVGPQSVTLSGLSPNTQYHFRIIGSSTGGTMAPTADQAQKTGAAVSTTLTGCCGPGTITTVSAPANTPLFFTVSNADTAPHTWQIVGQLGPSPSINPGNSYSFPSSVTLAAGTYTQQCTIHPGMTANLNVS